MDETERVRGHTLGVPARTKPGRRRAGTAGAKRSCVPKGADFKKLSQTTVRCYVTYVTGDASSAKFRRQPSGRVQSSRFAASGCPGHPVPHRGSAVSRHTEHSADHGLGRSRIGYVCPLLWPSTFDRLPLFLARADNKNKSSNRPDDDWQPPSLEELNVRFIAESRCYM
jgi:hypothetical protein